MSFVVQAWNVAAKTDKNEAHIEIQARAEGILSWLLSLIKVEPTTRLRANRNAVYFEQGNFLGYQRVQFHPSRISNTYVGYKKSITPLVVGGLLAPVTLGLSLLIGIVFYFLSKQVNLGFRVDGRDYSISLKTSVIHNIKVDENSAAFVVTVLEQLSLNASETLLYARAA